MDNNLKEVKIIAGFLVSALDIEDDMSDSVYGEYLIRETWPSNLDKEVFDMIKNLVMILIEESEGHKKAFLELEAELSRNESEGEDEDLSSSP